MHGSHKWMIPLVGLALASCQSERAVYRTKPDPGPAPPMTATAAPAKAAPKAAAPAAPKAAAAPPAAPTGGRAADAAALFARRCAVCHGVGGAGDGPTAAMLRPRPKSLADAAWQAQATDAKIKQVILHGGAAVGLSRSMPGAPDIAGDPGLVDALVRHVRGFGR